jgi:hypothetical protein
MSLGITFIFSRAAHEPAHANGFGPLPYKGWRPMCRGALPGSCPYPTNHNTISRKVPLLSPTKTRGTDVYSLQPETLPAALQS